MTEREVMTWDDLGAGARELAETVHRDAYQPDIVLAIARGGLLVAGALSYALGVKNTFTMNVEFYTGVDARARQGLPRGQGRRDALRRPLREGALDREVRVRLAPHRPLDRLPVERAGACGRGTAPKRLVPPGPIPYSRTRSCRSRMVEEGAA